MLKIKSLTLKNFMSVGNITQTVTFDQNSLVLILGENLDLGGNDNKNGTGKTTIVNGLSYALYGKPLVNVKMDNLINKTNQKSMMVTLDFEANGDQYRVERGRKPVTLRLIKNGQASASNQAQGENADTQETIDQIIGLGYDMFKHIVALNTYVEPFLSQRPSEQQALIEQLQGITKLSEKAERLKEEARVIKEQIREEEVRINTINESNKKIQSNITLLEAKSRTWAASQAAQLANIRDEIVGLEHLDIEAEIRDHEALANYRALETRKRELGRLLKQQTRTMETLIDRRRQVETQLGSICSSTCPTCHQTVGEDEHQRLKDQTLAALGQLNEEINVETEKLLDLEAEDDQLILPETRPDPFYPTLAEAYGHKTAIENLRARLELGSQTADPYQSQITALRETGLAEVDFSTLNELSRVRDHQAFLLKLLTHKDSYVRKKIIDQGLAFLNSRLTHYLTAIGLPHQVKFMPDLSTEITMYGKEFDFDNLSRGERTRLTLALSWAFRDSYESSNGPINLMFIDEITDQGLDSSGAENILKILKEMSRAGGRNTFLISHREEYVGRIDTVLKVVKENGFTTMDLQS